MISGAAIFLIIFDILVHFISPIWLYIRRHYHPIRARVPISVILGETITFLYTAWFTTCIVTEFNMSCYLYHLMTFAGSMVLFGVISVRIAILWFRYQITVEARALEHSDSDVDEKLGESGTAIPLVEINIEKIDKIEKSEKSEKNEYEKKTEKEKEDADSVTAKKKLKKKHTYLSGLSRMPKIGKQGWYTAHRHYISAKNLWIVGSSMTFINPLPFIGFYALYLSQAHGITLSTLASDEKCPLFSNIYFQIFFTFNVLNTVWAATKLRSIVEGLYIRAEFAIVAVLGFAPIILTIPFYHNHYPEQYFFFSSSICFSLASSYFPIALSYYYEYAMQDSRDNNEASRGSQSDQQQPPSPNQPPRKLEKVSLLSVLVTRDGFHDFEQFLTQEMALENLYFWRDVELLKNLINKAKKAQSILNLREEHKIEKFESPDKSVKSVNSDKSETETDATPSAPTTNRPNSPSSIEQSWKDHSSQEQLPLCGESPEIADSPQIERIEEHPAPTLPTLRTQISHSVKVIYEKYIARGAPFLINISYGLSEATREAYEKLPPDADFERLEKIYDGPQKEVYRLMCEDAFLRYLRIRKDFED